MKLQKAHIRNIRQANEEDRLAIFVGAGVSKSSENDYLKLPLWGDLIKELKFDLGISEEQDYLKLAQLYYLEFEEQKYSQTIKKYFPENIQPSDLHRKILALNPRLIITTNWDCIIERAIESEGYLYDTITTDQDLVKSTSQRKFIKIHGDFKSHNIVFKEDDYLNYSRNFPLIENYIKSVFSTHTVLFLGYSYNDINLKHIMKWIQSHSDSAPPMYLVSFEANQPQERYLKSHGIIALILERNGVALENIQASEGKSFQIQQFLDSILHEKSAVNPEIEQEVIGYFYDRVKHLKSLSAISYQQVVKAITNCRYHYDRDGLSVLELLVVRGDTDVERINITGVLHVRFMEILARIETLDDKEKEVCYERNSNLKDILYVLSKAGIKGIALPSSDGAGSTSYLYNDFIGTPESIEQENREYLSFLASKYKGNNPVKNLASEVYKEYTRGEYELAFKKNAELILVCKRHKIYSMLLVALFNKNSILLTLKGSLQRDVAKKFSEEEVVLQNEFFKFPEIEIKNNQVLYDFLSLFIVYQQASECSQKILDLKKTLESISAGGWSFNNNAEEPACKHVNLLMFSLKNHILIDKYAVYRSVMRDFVRISILRQKLKDSTTFNQYEIYSAIQFFSTKELKEELKEFYNGSGESTRALVINEECSGWIVYTLLPSLIDRTIQEQNIFSGNSDRFENCVRLLAVLNLSDDHVLEVMESFSRLIASRSTTIGIYEAINSFLGHQYTLFDRKIETDVLITMLNTLVDKIISHSSHGWDHRAIQADSIGNLYGYIKVAEGIYTDVVRIKQLVFELETYPREEQRSFAKTLLYRIFGISNSDVKNIIKNFIENIISKDKEEDVDSVGFDLWSVAVGFKKFDPEALKKLDLYLEEFRGGNVFSSSLYSLKDLVDYLISEKEVEGLDDIYAELNSIIGIHENRQNISTI